MPVFRSALQHVDDDPWLWNEWARVPAAGTNVVHPAEGQRSPTASVEGRGIIRKQRFNKRL
jgi:hypothetical protein